MNLSIQSDFIAHSMEKFQVLIDLDGLNFDEIQESLSAVKNNKKVF